MALIATPARRRIAMAVLLLLALAGGVMRQLAPDPSTLRDVGTLLLVLWLPVVGNLVAFLIRQIPRRPRPPVPGFPAGSAFVPHLQAQLEPLELPQALRGALAAAGDDCLVMVGRQAFTARLAQPLATALACGQPQPIQLLRPEAAGARLAPGTAFHLLVGSTAVARGRVLEAAPPPRQ